MKGQKGYAIVQLELGRGLPLGALAAAAWQQLGRWRQLARQRRQLATLNEEALKDLGLSRADVLQESERPFWDDPLAR
ncbi:DUF1127 domain-containing protein [Pseudomonas lalucatii]|uniref:DUF1127 domain-containing protein n=1 Tax=Pseudomonas lalucatii TaxID=1424203 RepID=A0ABS5PX96_9PSED|nr:DUF1127 domain-containing protein [Pseudomonas lalucatii]MBS7661102.1 DUF1127 domain-containing protein [Pseudomonas lalucatii]MBS7691615.1 DUF1127 domain-containing protein [Pseudomonas lalucatii]MBS7724279.1 DUF1127 domain-containing protein [Pseudomonas lalucatii]QVM87733.1 DUF1127 domain-containing protein [Pseudomonas lalucatii]